MSSQTMDCRNRSIPAVLHNERISSPNTTGNHLLICRNKTEYCLNFDQFIRRAIFSYHLENKFLNLNESGISLQRDNDSLSNCSQYSSQTNLSTIKNQEDKPLPNWFSKQQQRKPAIVECEYCHNQFSQKDYINHRV